MQAHTMVDWNRKFRSEYDAARAVLTAGEGFGPGWGPLVEQLAALMAHDGFDVGREEALTQLRRRLVEQADGSRQDEEAGLLRAAGVEAGGDSSAVAVDARRRAAAMKLLRHVYLQSRAGNRRLWVVALPSDFTDWPSRQLTEGAGNLARVRQLLAGRREHFTEEQRRLLATATQQALAWCQRAGMVLADAGLPDSGRSRGNGRAMVRRWFAEDGLPDPAVDALVATLARGFKDIVATLTRGHFVVTDWVPFRASTNADESDFLSTEAFAFRSRTEGLDVVYVEGAFFDDLAGNVLRGPANWTRILVHELSHLVCGTHDVNNGQFRYAWCGIGPHAGHPHGDAVRNADNWAFFAADCAGALAPGQREIALR
ncbi:MAG TPA: M35 family metallo-endopeptidase, partial [Burkholderiaceae bacterium]